MLIKSWSMYIYSGDSMLLSYVPTDIRSDDMSRANLIF